MDSLALNHIVGKLRAYGGRRPQPEGIIVEFSFFSASGEKARRHEQGFGLWLESTMKIIHACDLPRFGPGRGRLC